MRKRWIVVHAELPTLFRVRKRWSNTNEAHAERPTLFRVRKRWNNTNDERPMLLSMYQRLCGTNMELPTLFRVRKRWDKAYEPTMF